MHVAYASNAFVLICKYKNPKNNSLHRKQKIYTMTKMVPAAQDGDDIIQDMLSVTCCDNSKEKSATATTKSDYFDEKNKNSSALSPKNGVNNDVGSGETE